MSKKKKVKKSPTKKKVRKSPKKEAVSPTKKDSARIEKGGVESEEDCTLVSEIVVKMKNVTQKKYKDQYFQKIIDRIDPLVRKIAYKYNVAGHDRSDIYQEALFALRFKAIRDFDMDRTIAGDKVAFEKFASLCIKRHLSTLLKTSFQNKKFTLNSSISMHAQRDIGGEDETGSLLDILSDNSESNVDSLAREEQFNLIIVELLKILSSFEKKVLLLYAQRYSYKEITDIINENREKVKINIKGVDNALSRIKVKSRALIDKLNEDSDSPIYPL